MKNKFLITIALVILILIVSVSFSFAWLATSEPFFPNISGNSVTGYFKDGDGSQGDPYIIENSTHVYNLAWLQYMGLLNQESTDSEGNPIITQNYFKISDDIDVIDMNGVVIPPIGTADYPFVGHFDGNGKCISNLTVSNYLSHGENDFGIEKRPLSVTTIDGESVSVVGFFGVVGALDEATKAKLANDSETENIQEKVNAVYNLFLDNLTVRTETNRSLIGLFAGYVNGSVANVGIGESSINVSGITTALTEGDAFNMQRIISAYSLIGKYNETNVEWVDKPTGGSGGGSDTGGSGAGWGGTLNMLEINTRISRMFAKFDNTSGYKVRTAIDDGFNINFYSYQAAPFVESTVGHIAYIGGQASTQFTYIPLNVDFGSYATKDADGNIKSVDYDGYYNNNSTEKPLSTNTGYLVGARIPNNSAIRTRVEQYSRVFNSLNLSSQGTITYAKNPALDILTVKGGTWYLIKDSYNENSTLGSNIKAYNKLTASELKLSKYIVVNEDKTTSGVRVALGKLLTENNYLQGLHFYQFIPIATNGVVTRDSLTSVDAIATVDNASGNVLLGDIAAKDLVAGSIDFSLAGDGMITVVAGTTMNTSKTAYSLFDMYKVERDADGKINRLIEISTIHYDIATKQHSYNKSTTDDIVYSSAWTANLPVSNAMYYFEIPVMAGEYAIASKSGANPGAYLYYLDIGANGDSSDSGGNDGPTTVPSHKMEAVTFVDSNAIANKTTADYSAVTFKIEVADGISTHGGLTMSFNRTSPTHMSYSQDDPSSAFTVEFTKDDAQLTVEKVQNMLIADFQKKVYFRRREAET